MIVPARLLPAYVIDAAAAYVVDTGQLALQHADRIAIADRIHRGLGSAASQCGGIRQPCSHQ